MTDILSRIDAAIDGRCPCGAEPRPGDPWCSEDCVPVPGAGLGYDGESWSADGPAMDVQETGYVQRGPVGESWVPAQVWDALTCPWYEDRMHRPWRITTNFARCGCGARWERPPLVEGAAHQMAVYGESHIVVQPGRMFVASNPSQPESEWRDIGTAVEPFELVTEPDAEVMEAGRRWQNIAREEIETQVAVNYMHYRQRWILGLIPGHAISRFSDDPYIPQPWDDPDRDVAEDIRRQPRPEYRID